MAAASREARAIGRRAQPLIRWMTLSEAMTNRAMTASCDVVVIQQALGERIWGGWSSAHDQDVAMRPRRCTDRKTTGIDPGAFQPVASVTARKLDERQRHRQIGDAITGRRLASNSVK